jgi:hypothetical protein
VSVVANSSGVATFTVAGTVDWATYLANANFPEPDPPAPSPGAQFYFGCATVTVNGNPTVPPRLIASAFKHNVTNPGVDSGDLASCLADVLSGNYRERSDYDVSVAAGGAGVLNSGDLSRIIGVALAGNSFTTCTPAESCP